VPVPGCVALHVSGRVDGRLHTHTHTPTTNLPRAVQDEIGATSGAAYLAGYDVATEIQARTKIGYCPQFDCLIDFMTGREVCSPCTPTSAASPISCARRWWSG
jgi:hypothetical protein